MPEGGWKSILVMSVWHIGEKLRRFLRIICGAEVFLLRCGLLECLERYLMAQSTGVEDEAEVAARDCLDLSGLICHGAPIVECLGGASLENHPHRR